MLIKQESRYGSIQRFWLFKLHLFVMLSHKLDSQSVLLNTFHHLYHPNKFNKRGHQLKN
jgi:hypothetical protein